MVITARTLSEGDHIFEGSLESTQKLIQDAGGVCEIIAGNVGDPDECAAIIDQVHGIFGPIYCLVNNAAVEWPMEAVELSPKRWQTTFNVCVHGPFYLSQICLRDDMGPAKSGRIINISSSAAIGPGFVGLGPAHEDETCCKCRAALRLLPSRPQNCLLPRRRLQSRGRADDAGAGGGGLGGQVRGRHRRQLLRALGGGLHCTAGAASVAGL